MKNRLRFIAAVITGIAFTTIFSFGQTQPQLTERQQIRANLTPEQKALLEANHSSIVETRKAFKASLTHEQRDMLSNNSLTVEQKRANLRASLSEGQKQILTENRQMRLKQKHNFQRSLSLQQKQMMKKAYYNRMGKFDGRPGLKRLPRHIRR